MNACLPAVAPFCAEKESRNATNNKCVSHVVSRFECVESTVPAEVPAGIPGQILLDSHGFPANAEFTSHRD